MVPKKGLKRHFGHVQRVKHTQEKELCSNFAPLFLNKLILNEHKKVSYQVSVGESLGILTVKIATFHLK